MTKREIEILKMLGYVDSIEDGAILQHSVIDGYDRYVWEDDSLAFVLERYNARLEGAIRDGIASAILNKRHRGCP